jgi:hypothetical protein
LFHQIMKTKKKVEVEKKTQDERGWTKIELIFQDEWMKVKMLLSLGGMNSNFWVQ